MGALDNAFHELERGKQHLADLDSHLFTTFTKDTIRWEVQTQVYLKNNRLLTRYTVSVHSVPVVSLEDRALLGDVVQCFRQSLDFFAWELITKRRKSSLTQKQRHSIYFPMTKGSRSFRTTCAGLLQNLPADQRAFLESYQPYKHSPEAMAIRELRNLSNPAKHRSYIEPAIWVRTGNFEFQGSDIQSNQFGPIVFHVRDGQEIEAGTKIATVTLSGIHREVKVRSYGEIAPVFSKNVLRPAGDNNPVPVEAALKWICQVCEKILTEGRKYF